MHTHTPVSHLRHTGVQDVVKEGLQGAQQTHTELRVSSGVQTQLALTPADTAARCVDRGGGCKAKLLGAGGQVCRSYL